jgi:hypothetical protein
MWSAPRLSARQLRGNTLLQQQQGCVFCAVWSVPRKYKSRIPKLAAVGVQKNTGVQESTRMRIELSVGDSHGKLVVEEELEVDLWKLSVS